VSTGRRLLGARVALLLVAAAIIGVLVQTGGLGWPGRTALASTPRLEWR
jgi:hypothetical protein